MNTKTPDIAFPELFRDVQLSGLFQDGSTFAYAIPKISAKEINSQYQTQKANATFDLRTFVEHNFFIPNTPRTSFIADTNLNVEEHIARLWPFLEKNSDNQVLEDNSPISLPYPYVVNMGSSNEVQYWGSYFTMLGLQVTGKVDDMANMVKNFAWLIDTFGHIPSVNRNEYLSRSHPPFFSLMVQLMAEEQGDEIVLEYLPQLEKEHSFWMEGIAILNKHESIKRVLKLEDGAVLNRYWDSAKTPRPAMYKYDVELAEKSTQYEEELFRNVRAACESGWDFSSRWCKDPLDLTTIDTQFVIPLDLNCLLFHLEKSIAKGYELKREAARSLLWNNKAIARAGAIRTKFWDKKKLFFFDVDAVNEEPLDRYSLAALYPLFFKIANDNQAKEVADIVEEKFLQSGGVVTTLINSGQQWDWPNGWAPLQWVTIKGLRNYGYHELANNIAQRWLALIVKTYKHTGKMLEKYNVVDTDLEASGGAYPFQDGFGWTNGVYLKLKNI